MINKAYSEMLISFIIHIWYDELMNSVSFLIYCKRVKSSKITLFLVCKKVCLFTIILVLSSSSVNSNCSLGNRTGLFSLKVLVTCFLIRKYSCMLNHVKIIYNYNRMAIATRMLLPLVSVHWAWLLN